MLSAILNVIALLALAGVGVYFIIATKTLSHRLGLRRALVGGVLGIVAGLMSVLSLPPDNIGYLASIVGPLMLAGFIGGFGGALTAALLSVVPVLIMDQTWLAILHHGLAAFLGAGLSYGLYGASCVKFTKRAFGALLLLAAGATFTLHALPTGITSNSVIGCLVFSLSSTVIAYGMLALAVRAARDLRTLAEFEARMTMASEVAQIGTWDWDIASDACTWDAGMHRIYGSDPDSPKVSPKDFIDRVHDDDRQRLLTSAEAATVGGAPQHDEFRAYHVDGSLRTIHSALKNQYDSAGTLVRISGLHMDVTHLRQAEALRGEAETRLKNVIDSVPGALLTYQFGPNGQDSATFLNAHCETLFELDAETARKDARALFRVVEPLDLEELTRAVQASTRTGEVFVHRWRINLPSGRTRWVEGHGMPRKLGDGAIEFSTVLVDITDHVRTQKELVAEQDRTRRTERLETIGKLSGGVAHDFNNLLAIIVGNLEMLQEELTGENQKLGYVREGLNAAMRGADLVRNMLTFARRARLEPAQQEVCGLLDRVSGWVGRILPATIDVQIEAGPDTWPLHVDAAGAENALINLILNARDAMPDGGSLHVQAKNRPIRVDDPILVTGASVSLSPGDYVMITVQDTGEGIAPADLERVFEPFYSTKQSGQTSGSGLGLSTVLGFMEQSGGGIGIDTTRGAGTRITLFFPAWRSPAAPAIPLPERRSSAPTRTGTRVLLAEDEAQVAAVLRRALEMEGHTVSIAPSGDAAVALFAQQGPFDILVTDIVMPGTLQGPDLAAELRRTVPDLPAVFLSGYAPDAVFEANGVQPGDIRLMKPVARTELSEAVAQALKTRAAQSTAAE